MPTAISLKASKQASHVQAGLRLGLLVASIASTACLAQLLSVSFDIPLSLSCIHNALSFETGRCAFWAAASVPWMVWLALGLLTLCVLLQLIESLWWWRRAYRERVSGNEYCWLALGGESLGDEPSGDTGLSGAASRDMTEMTSLLTVGVLEDMSEESRGDDQESDQEDVGQAGGRDSVRGGVPQGDGDEGSKSARHRRPGMRLCWWWADTQSTTWRAVSVHCVWCSPRLIGLRVTPAGEPSRTLWLWPDSGNASDLHQLRLWLLWPPQPHDMPRQPPVLEAIRTR